MVSPVCGSILRMTAGPDSVVMRISRLKTRVPSAEVTAVAVAGLVGQHDVHVHDGLTVQQRDVAPHAGHLEALVELEVDPLLLRLVVVADGGPGHSAHAREPGQVDVLGTDVLLEFLEKVAPERRA